MYSTSILDFVFSLLPLLSNGHAPTSEVYLLLKQVARREIENLFSGREAEGRGFGPFGSLVFPYYEMGAVDSLNCFDLDELILYSFYWTNRNRYQRVLDIGANIGLHTILLTKCGFEVRAYEPDPIHFEILQKNLALNNCAAAKTFNTAISNMAGAREFVRVLGNTTASHLAGSRPNPYGALERFSVKVEDIDSIISWADLVKVDVEGHEKEIILAMNNRHWSKTDALVEIGNEHNATLIYEHLKTSGVRFFSQKNNWQPVHSINDMPKGYRDGSLFISCKDKMPWGK